VAHEGRRRGGRGGCIDARYKGDDLYIAARFENSALLAALTFSGSPCLPKIPCHHTHEVSGN
jgi:hypothetical protein